MKQVYSLQELGVSSQRSSVVIGNLDGVHRGHQALIAAAKAKAMESGGQTAVLTFSPHPQELLRGKTLGHRLSTDQEKAALLEATGVDLVFSARFDRELAALSPQHFFEIYLKQGMRASSIHIGEDFRFGKDREGDKRLLEDYAKESGISVQVTPAVVHGAEKISSSVIREKITAGKVEEAAVFLGRPYFLSGDVVKGAGRGTRLGIPTANIAYPCQKVVPAAGVYETQVLWRGKTFASVTNLGHRPTFASSTDPALVLETHVLDFSQSLYGQELTVKFLSRLRDERRFANVDELRRQIERDVENVRSRKNIPFDRELE